MSSVAATGSFWDKLRALNATLPPRRVDGRSDSTAPWQGMGHDGIHSRYTNGCMGWWVSLHIYIYIRSTYVIWFCRLMGKWDSRHLKRNKRQHVLIHPSKGPGTKRPEVANAAPLISSMGGVSAKDSALEGCLLGKIKLMLSINNNEKVFIY